MTLAQAHLESVSQARGRDAQLARRLEAENDALRAQLQHEFGRATQGRHVQLASPSPDAKCVEADERGGTASGGGGAEALATARSKQAGAMTGSGADADPGSAAKAAGAASNTAADILAFLDGKGNDDGASEVVLEEGDDAAFATAMESIALMERQLRELDGAPQ